MRRKPKTPDTCRFKLTHSNLRMFLFHFFLLSLSSFLPTCYFSSLSHFLFKREFILCLEIVVFSHLRLPTRKFLLSWKASVAVRKFFSRSDKEKVRSIEVLQKTTTMQQFAEKYNIRAAAVYPNKK